MSGDIGRVTTSLYTDGKKRCPCCKMTLDEGYPGRLLPCLHTVCNPCLSKVEKFLKKLERKQRPPPHLSPGPATPLGYFLCPACHTSHLVTKRGGTCTLLLSHGNTCHTPASSSPTCHTPHFYSPASHAPLPTISTTTTTTTSTSSSSSTKSVSCCLLPPAPPLSYYCHDCSQLLCRGCVQGNHATHLAQDIDVVSKSVEKALSEALEEIQERMKAIDISIDKIRAVRKAGYGDRKVLRKEVMSFYEGYVNNVRQHKKCLEDKIDNHQKEKESLLLREELQLEQYKCDLDILCHQIQTILEKKEKSEVVSVMVPLAKRLEILSDRILATGEAISHRLDFKPTQLPENCQHGVPNESRALEAPGIPDRVEVLGIPGRVEVPGIPGRVEVPAIPGRVEVPGIPGRMEVPDVPVIPGRITSWAISAVTSHVRLDSGAYEKVLCSFPIILTDANGTKLEVYRNPKIQAVMTLFQEAGKYQEVATRVERVEGGGGEWRVVFTPPHPGIARLAVSLAGQEIKNSPYVFNIRSLSLDSSYTQMILDHESVTEFSL